MTAQRARTTRGNSSATAVTMWCVRPSTATASRIHHHNNDAVVGHDGASFFVPSSPAIPNLVFSGCYGARSHLVPSSAQRGCG